MKPSTEEILNMLDFKNWKKEDLIAELEFRTKMIIYRIEVEFDKLFISKEQTRKELKKRLLTPNTKSKNYIEIPDFEYWLDKVFG